MPHIQVLDQITIDKIAAGEVIERPASIVKELVENAIDAGATSVNVEIEDGGISSIRITDNGCGIEKKDIQKAFLRHSTSKIRQVEDLTHITSLGFRGEALSSIAAVTKVELTTKPKDEIFGCRYVIEGGKEISLDDVGASDGTTFEVRKLFYNIPARRKFLKTAMTEAGHVQDLLLRLALSHPDVSFCFRNNGQEKLRTNGSGKLKEVIYQVYGRDIAANLLEIDYEQNGIHMTGYLGKPVITRGNRNFETFFVNGRYVKSSMISKAVEDAYKDFMMQHKFPFVVLHFDVDGSQVDVNVHPTKMELRFQRQQDVYNSVYEGIHRRLLEPEFIPQVPVPEPVKKEECIEEKVEQSPFLLKPKAQGNIRLKTVEKVPANITQSVDKTMQTAKKEPVKPEERDEEYFIKKMRERVMSYHNRSSSAEVSNPKGIFKPEIQNERIQNAVRESGSYCTARAVSKAETVPKDKSEVIPAEKTAAEKTEKAAAGPADKASPKAEMPKKSVTEEKPQQLNMFDENFLKREIRAEYKLIGQVFDTYWLVQFQDNLYIIDQHAAHERVLYERTLKEMKNREYTSQYLSPPIILHLSMQEEQILNEHIDVFTRIGFEIEPFGQESYAVRAVPDNLFSIAKKELLLEMLDQMSDGLTTTMTPELIDEKIASMSCKAAVKGNNRLSAQEVNVLIGELLQLENPYHCPHGRPTIISMSKKEMEKKFKRIV